MSSARPTARLLRQVLAIPEIGIAIAVVVLAAGFWAVSPALLSGSSVTVMLRTLPFVGIIAIGETFLMIGGELDLSVGKVAGLCAIVSAWLMVQHHWPTPLGLAAGLCLGALIGLVNGVLAVWARIPAFIVTLGMFYVAFGANYLISHGYPIWPLPDSLTDFGCRLPFGRSWLISWTFLIFVALAAAGQFVLSRTVWGRMVCATGGNREVARIAGIHTAAVKIFCYVLTSTLAVLAGILQTAWLGSAPANTGEGWELTVIATVVIGGISLFGGVGSIIGTMLGLLLMQILQSGLFLSGASSYWQTVSFGVIMVAAVGLDLMRRRAKRV